MTFALNGLICSRSGKRVAKHLPRIAGPWLAGGYDTDRSVTQAAQDALQTVFTSPEKIGGLKKTFHDSIWEYCQTAILNETPQSLSDERTVSPDDAAATYGRVVSASIAVASDLIGTFSIDNTSKYVELYANLLDDPGLWKFSHHTDQSVRRALHRFVRTCIESQPKLVENALGVASTAYIYKSLPSDQTGSAFEFVKTLVLLTKTFPSIWTGAYSGKRAALSRLQAFLKTGSQAGPRSFWDILDDLLISIPSELLPSTYDGISELLKSLHEGVIRKEERPNAPAGWKCFVTLFDISTRSLPESMSEKVAESFALPILDHFFNPSDVSAEWSINGPGSVLIVARLGSLEQVKPMLIRRWPELSGKLLDHAKMSQPEQSSSFEKSQKTVAAAGQRFADLQRELGKQEPQYKSTFLPSSIKLTQGCISLLRSRNGKPFGAAAIINAHIQVCGDHLMQDQSFRDLVLEFTTAEIPKLIFSPSQTYLARIFLSFQSEIQFGQIFSELIKTIITSDEENDAKMSAVGALFPADAPMNAVQIGHESKILQDFAAEHMNTNDQDRELSTFSRLIELGVISKGTTESMLCHLTKSLSLAGDDHQARLSKLEYFAKSNHEILRALVSDLQGPGPELLSNVLLLEQSEDESIASRAAAVSKILTATLGEASHGAKYGAILQNLTETSNKSLPMDTVLELVERIVGNETNLKSLDEILPSTEVWLSALLTIMQLPKLSLSILSPLGGAVNSVRPDAHSRQNTALYDTEGLSQALRIAMVFSKIYQKIEARGVDHNLPDSPAYLSLLSIVVFLAEDNISISGSNGLWVPTIENTAQSDILIFITEANSLLTSLSKHACNPSRHGRSEQESYVKCLGDYRSKVAATSPMAYYIAYAFVRAYQTFFDKNGFSKDDSATGEKLLATRHATDLLTLTASLQGYREPLNGSQSLNRLCNELISDLTTIELSSDEMRPMKNLALLTTILSSQEDIIDGISKSRRVFLVKHIISWISEDTTLPFKAEIFKVLVHLLPSVSDMYGEHWAQMLEALVKLWHDSALLNEASMVSEPGVVIVHASLKLYATLFKMTKSGANDDLVESLQDHRKHIFVGLISLLKSAASLVDDNHSPLKLTNEMIARQISQLPYQKPDDVEDLYPLLNCQSQAIQCAAFDLLRQHIQETQEQVSFDAALDNKAAKLPDELLSLVIQNPGTDFSAWDGPEQELASDMRGYLFSWRLIFVHFDKSSYRVKGDYLDQIRENAILPSLLRLIFDFLGHTSGRPIDASQFDLETFTEDSQITHREAQHLMSHLFYLALLHLPNLVQSCVRDVRSRQTSQAIEKWTAKFISPLIVAASLQDVASWAETSAKEDPEYENMTIKVGQKSKEINVSYLVDEQTMAIKVVLPETYPLDSAKVLSVNRVAVKEEKWQSWLRNCQGVITFSVGSAHQGSVVSSN